MEKFIMLLGEVVILFMTGLITGYGMGYIAGFRRGVECFKNLATGILNKIGDFHGNEEK